MAPRIPVLSAVLAVALVAPCGEPARPCPAGFVGDRNASPLLELWALGENGETIPLQDGTAVPILIPPQGGRVLFIGARATNLDACGVELSAALRDPGSGQLRLDGRTINLQADGSGWASSSPQDFASVANVPVCPNQWSGADIFDVPYSLEVSLVDAFTQRTAGRTVTIRPVCPASDPTCRCLCR
jgi:hypothetical protein